MGRFKPKAWYEEQQPDQASADDADVAGILAAQERFRRWFGLEPDCELEPASDRVHDQRSDDAR